MTLVYAKIIGMFVCGAAPGGRGWDWGAGVGVVFFGNLFRNQKYTYVPV